VGTFNWRVDISLNTFSTTELNIMGLKRATYTDRLGFVMRSFTPEMTEKFNSIVQANKLGIIEQYTVALMIRAQSRIGTSGHGDKNVTNALKTLGKKGVITFVKGENYHFNMWELKQ
jgi:hypothetical protein